MSSTVLKANDLANTPFKKLAPKVPENPAIVGFTSAVKALLRTYNGSNKTDIEVQVNLALGKALDALDRQHLPK